MSNFDPLLEALRELKSSGDEGFEGLLRDCLETLAQRTLRLQKSGAQAGQDFRSNTDALVPTVAIEAKRFGTATSLPLDELKSKLRESLESFPPPDLWGVILSHEMKMPDWAELEVIGAEYGVTLLCMDWRSAPGTLPVIAAICAVGRNFVEARLGADLSWLLAEVEQHPDFRRIIEELRGKLTAAEVGFDLAKAAARKWLIGAASREFWNAQRAFGNQRD
jgi:hypothetical protein